MKKVPQFEDVDSHEFLAALAKKVNKLTFKYGEIVIQEGDVPQHMFMIAEGQCRVMLQGIGERKHLQHRKMLKQEVSAKDINCKIRVQNPLLHNFDPENSVLQRVNSMSRNYQNARILVNQEGKENKTKIQYEE